MTTPAPVSMLRPGAVAPLAAALSLGLMLAAAPSTEVRAGEIGGGGLCARADGPPIAVVASIRPVHGLVAAVMEGVATPALLVRGAASPHDHAMRPSEARMLGAARVIFWIGAELETFLAEPLAAPGAEVRAVALLHAARVATLPSRPAGVFTPATAPPPEETPDHGPEGKAEQRAPAHRHTDPHVWLDPANAKAMAAAVAKALGAADPANRRCFEANAARLAARIDALDGALGDLLAPAAGLPYIVVHDAYRYLERRYGLTPAAAVSPGPDHPPGARRLAEVREVIEAMGARCIVAGPRSAPGLARTIAGASGARIVTLDPLGAAIAPGPDFYFDLMTGLARGLRRCLVPAAG